MLVEGEGLVDSSFIFWFLVFTCFFHSVIEASLFHSFDAFEADSNDNYDAANYVAGASADDNCRPRAIDT